VLAAVRVDCGDDALDDVSVDQKVLAESFSRYMPTSRHRSNGRFASQLVAISIAASTASKRLSGSARSGAGKLDRRAVVDRRCGFMGRPSVTFDAPGRSLAYLSTGRP